MAANTKIRIDYPDTDLQSRVQRFIRSTDASAFNQIDVEVDEGEVTLRGPVSSYYQKQLVLNTCRRVAGVLCVIDRVNVD